MPITVGILANTAMAAKATSDESIAIVTLRCRRFVNACPEPGAMALKAAATVGNTNVR